MNPTKQCIESKQSIKQTMGCQDIHIFTDGAYFKQHNSGGWAYILYCNQNEVRRDSGLQEVTHSLEMELTAAYRALQTVAESSDLNSTASNITVHTDSRIIIEGLTQKISQWQLDNWKVKSGKTVVCKNLWQELHKLTTDLGLNWQWVKGHSGIEGNEIADQLARQAALQKVQTI